MAARFDQASEFAVIVNFAVQNDGDRTVFVENRLMASGHVNDRKPPMAESDSSGDVKTFVVRPAMSKRAGHSPQDGFVDRLIGFVIVDSGNSAHGVTLTQASLSCEKSMASTKLAAQS